MYKSPLGLMEEDHITYASVSVPRLHNLKRNLPKILPWVDRALIVIGVQDEEAISYLKSLGEKVSILYREWDGSFPDQYNVYLPYITGGWVLIQDDDELASDELLQTMRPLIGASGNGRHFDVVAFRCQMVGHGYEETHNRSDEEEPPYREIFYRWNPTLHYEVEVHQSLVGLRGPQIKRQECYYHIKDDVDLLRNACRSYFVGGRWDDNEGKNPITSGVKEADWHVLHDLLKRNHPEVEKFPHLHKLMIDGTVCDEFRTWAEKYKDNELRAGGELKSFYKYQKYLDENHSLRGKPILE